MMLYTIVIPVYKNEESLPDLLSQLEELNTCIQGQFGMSLEVVFVVDGSPDNSFGHLSSRMNQLPFPFQVAALSRNFGAFSAVRAGLSLAKGDFIATKAADNQEPIQLYVEFLKVLYQEKHDVVVAMRKSRDDPWFSKVMAKVFWGTYRRIIQNEIPPGGADVFGCTKEVRNNILKLRELNTSLIGLLFWIGFKRKMIPYTRLAREKGKSSWSFQKKIHYVMDSFFAFSDLPIKLMYFAGGLGITFSIIFSIMAIWDKLNHNVDVPGYTATILVISFFGGLNLLAFGIIGSYVWRSYENTKRRPDFIIMKHLDSVPIS
jgi:glycosyltransferase involved in cell wall biosynthesis